MTKIINNKYDDIIPERQWQFNDAVANCFDNMLERSIPGYERMREVVFEFGKEFVKKNTTIIDIGCSLGNAIDPFIKKYGNNCYYIGIEQSASMVEKVRQRFSSQIKDGIVDIRKQRIEDYFPEKNVSLVLSVLTLQFVDLDSRQEVINKLYESLNQNGAIILVEKIRTNNQRLFEKIYYDLKRRNGYSDDQIYSKKKSLSNCLIPLSKEENEGMLKEAGFNNIECIWSDILFSAWIAIKE